MAKIWLMTSIAYQIRDSAIFQTTYPPFLGISCPVRAPVLKSVYDSHTGPNNAFISPLGPIGINLVGGAQPPNGTEQKPIGRQAIQEYCARLQHEEASPFDLGADLFEQDALEAAQQDEAKAVLGEKLRAKHRRLD